MKLPETILLSLAVAFLIIGVHQTFTVGILQSYWIFMFSIALLLIFKWRRNKDIPHQPSAMPKNYVASKKRWGKNTTKRSIRK